MSKVVRSWCMNPLCSCASPLCACAFGCAQAAKDVAETMSKSRNVVYIPSSGNMLMQINPNQ